MINVTKPYLPDRKKLQKYIDRIYESGWLTNNGPLVRELENRLKDYLGVKHLILVANGTLALQVAYKALGLTGEVVTTPFSFVATTSSLVWEGLAPVFADIDPRTWNISPEEIEKHITPQTSAIVPVHVFGNACDVEAIAEIALRKNLKVVYDAAHAFGVKYKGASILNWGDVSTLSFHATKLFHTNEGGAVITNDDELATRVRLMINFGMSGPEGITELGINAKMNEFSAAMGLCVLDDIEVILQERRKVWKAYRDQLESFVSFQQQNPSGTQNYSYFPVLFKTSEVLKCVQKTLNDRGIFPRRYFYPSLDSVDNVVCKGDCRISRDIAGRILCLPLYPGLDPSDQQRIIEALMA